MTNNSDYWSLQPQIEWRITLIDGEKVVIMATDFNHAVTEAVDEFNWANIVAIEPLPK